jgi:hypothetical protein
MIIQWCYVLTHVANTNVVDYLSVVLAVFVNLSGSYTFFKVKQTSDVDLLDHVEEGSKCPVVPVHLQLSGL